MVYNFELHTFGKLAYRSGAYPSKNKIMRNTFDG